MNSKDIILNETTVVKPLQIATIDHNIDSIVADIKNEIANLNIGSMEVSEDNKQTLKDVRASLNKKLALFESERKKVKDFILQPYNDFEDEYKNKLKVVIDEAITEVDLKVKSIEEEEKLNLKNYAIEYFDRKLLAEPIEFANTFDDVDLKITLTLNKKKIRETIDFHFEKVSSASIIIANHPHSVRLRAIFIHESQFDIGIALTKLEKQLSREREYQATVINEIPKEMVVTKVPVVEEKVLQKNFEETFDFSLRITVTEPELKDLIEFIKSRGILFEVEDVDDNL
jgi:hypothetical protein